MYSLFAVDSVDAVDSVTTTCLVRFRAPQKIATTCPDSQKPFIYLLGKEDTKTDLPSPERQRIIELVDSLDRLEHWSTDEFTSATEASDESIVTINRIEWKKMRFIFVKPSKQTVVDLPYVGRTWALR